MFRRRLTLIGSVGALTIAGCKTPEIQGPSDAEWNAAFAIYSARLYGQVTLPRNRTAGAGISIVVTAHLPGCTGRTGDMYFNETTTDADGRFQVRSSVWRSSLPPGNPDSRVLCAKITASGALPGDTASVFIPDLMHRVTASADSTRADLRLP